MAVNLKKLISAGADITFYGVLDSTGTFIGNSATAPAAGSQDGAPAAQLDGVKNAPHTVVEPESVTVTGDNSVLGQFQFEPAELASFVLEVGTRDLTFEALCQGTAVHDAGDLSIGVVQPGGVSYQDMCLLVEAEAKSRASGTTGVAAFETLLIPNCTIVPLMRDGYQERAAGTYRYRVTVNAVDSYPWGLALNDTNNGTTEGSGFIITSENRLHMMAFTGDGSETTFNLDYTPAEESGDKVLVYVDGVLSTYTTAYTVSASAKTMTFETGSIPASGAKIVVLYEYSV